MDFAEVVRRKIPESRKSPQANKKPAYNCQTIAFRDSLTNQIQQYIEYNHMTTWWLPPDVVLFEFLYLHFLQLIMVRSEHFFTNNTLQTIGNSIQRG